MRWQCPVAEDHRWSAPPKRRAGQGSGCPACSGRQASTTNSLAALFPDIASELDVEAPVTAGLTADQIVAGSHKRVGWRCSACEHRWEAQVGPRTGRQRAGCPACAGHVVTTNGNLATTRPEIAAQWHPVRNGDLRPQDVRPGSSRSVWWRCPVHADHEWRAVVNARTHPANPTGCPACSGYQLSATNNLAVRFPALAEQFDPALNAGRTPDQVLAGTRERVTWRCPVGPDHVWSSGVVERTASGNGCPFCAGRRASVTNHLASLPELVAEFDLAANAPDTPHTLAQSSRKKVWWACPKSSDHRWQVSVAVRAKAGHGCPFCAGQRVSVTNSLLTRFPEAAAQLDPAINGGLTADQVTASVSRLVTWRCEYGHTWLMTIKARTRALAAGAGGCPYCYPYGASLRQLAVASALAYSLPGLTVNDRPAPIHAAGRPRHVDITIPQLRLVLEYDGGFFHARRERQDGEKSNALREAGWQVVRLREAPLDRIDAQDLPVPVTAPAYADELVPQILNHLRSVLDEASLETLQHQLLRPLPDKPAWQWTSPPPLFLDGLQALQAFVAREGHALPPSEHIEEDFRLGRWVMRQRRMHRDGKLSRPEQQLLEGQTNWSWDWREHRWDTFITALTRFADREGHLQVPQDHRESSYPLGAKVAQTRGMHRSRKLSPQRQAELAALPGWTWEPDRRRCQAGGPTQLAAFSV